MKWVECVQQNKGYESLLNTNKPGNAHKRQDKASALAVLWFIRSVITSGNWWMLRFSTTVHSFKVLAFRRKSIQKQADQSERSRDWIQSLLSITTQFWRCLRQNQDAQLTSIPDNIRRFLQCVHFCLELASSKVIEGWTPGDFLYIFLLLIQVTHTHL